MLSPILEFADLLITALLVGIIFAVWLIFDPTGLDGPTYILQQQLGIRSLNVVMPMLGGISVILTLAAAFSARDDRTRLILFGCAAACLITAGLITRFLNQPINSIVMTWSAAAAPVDWERLRDEWWRWHLTRLGFGLGALSLLVAAVLRR